MRKNQLDGTVQDEIVITGSNVEYIPNVSIPAAGKFLSIGGPDGGAKGRTASVDSWGASDAFGFNYNGLFVISSNMAWNDGPVAKSERIRNNTTGTLLASAARTASLFSPNQTNFNARGVMIFYNVTAASGTGGLTFWISFPDPVSGQTVQTKLNSAAITATGFGMFAIYPGVGAAPAGIAGTINMPLPRVYNVYVQHGDATSYTYSVGYALIL